MRSPVRKLSSTLLLSATLAGCLSLSPLGADELELVMQSGHQSRVVDALFVDDDTLVSASIDGSIKLWHVPSQRVRRTLWLPTQGEKFEGVADLAKSAEGVWALYDGGTLVLWDINAGKVLREVALPSDGSWYNRRITVDSNKGVHIQSDYFYCVVRPDKPLEVYKSESALEHFDVSADGKTRVYSTSKDIVVERSKERFTLPQTFAGRWGVEGLLLDPSGERLYVSTAPGWLEAWDLSTRELLFQTPFEENPYSKELLSGAGWGGQDLTVILSPYDEERILATERRSGKLFLVHQRTGEWKKVGSLEDTDLTQVEFSPSRTALTAGHGQKEDVLLAFLEGESVRSHRLGGDGDFFSKAELSDGKLCLSSTKGESIITYDLKSGTPYRKFPVGYFPSMAVKAGKLYCGGNDGVLYCYDIKTGQELWSRDLTIENARFGYGPRDITINPSGDQLAVAVSQHRSEIHVLDGSTGKTQVTIDSTGTEHLLFSNDGRQLFITKAREVMLYDMNYRKVLHTWTLPGSRTAHIVGMVNHPLEDAVIVLDREGRLLKFQRNRLDLPAELVATLNVGAAGRIRTYGNNLLICGGRKSHLVSTKGKVLQSYGLHLARTSDALPVGDTILSTGWDSMVGFWGQDDGRERARLYSLKNGKEWLITSPDYNFDGSQEAQNLLEWRWNGELYQVSRFFEKFYEPGLLSRVVSERARTVQTSPTPRTALGSRPPTVKIAQPKALTGGEYEVKLEIEGTHSGWEDVRLYHNGHRVLGENPYRFTAVGGRNVLRASAFNTDKTIESEPEKLVFHVDAKDEPSTLYVFAAAVNDYPNPLDFAVPDAKSFSEAFKPGLYEKVEKVLLLDRDATKSSIIEKLSSLPCRPQDTLLVFLAGHGTIIDEKFHYLPFGTTGSKSEEALSSQELGQVLAKLPATRQVLFLDTCHAGASAKDLAELLVEKDTPLTASVSGSQFIKDQKLLARQAGTFLVAGSTPNATAAEVPQLGHGIFTYAVLSGLTAEEIGHDKEITVNELLRYLNEKVPELSMKFRGSPLGIWQFSAGQDFPIAKP